MPSTPLYDKTGKTVGNVELSDELFAAPVNTAVLHQVVTAPLAARADRHARHQDPRRDPRRRQEAVPPRRVPAAPARAPSPRRTTAAVASSSGRIRARTSSGCRAR